MLQKALNFLRTSFTAAAPTQPKLTDGTVVDSLSGTHFPARNDIAANIDLAQETITLNFTAAYGGINPDPLWRLRIRGADGAEKTFTIDGRERAELLGKLRGQLAVTGVVTEIPIPEPAPRR